MGSLMQMSIALWMALAAADPQALEREAKLLEAKLMAPCCWAQQVSLHQSPAADEIKQNIRRLLAEGKTSQQILDTYVAEYGDRDPLRATRARFQPPDLRGPVGVSGRQRRPRRGRDPAPARRGPRATRRPNGPLRRQAKTRRSVSTKNCVTWTSV